MRQSGCTSGSVASGTAEVARAVEHEGRLRLHTDSVAIVDHQLHSQIDPIAAVRITLPSIAATGHTHWTQFASADVLNDLSETVVTSIAVPADVAAP